MDVLNASEYILYFLNLRINDIDLATKSKSGLEHRQREEARLRKEANEKWDTKVNITVN